MRNSSMESVRNCRKMGEFVVLWAKVNIGPPERLKNGREATAFAKCVKKNRRNHLLHVTNCGNISAKIRGQMQMSDD